MEFSVKTSEILPKLELAAGVSEHKATIPILSNILIQASEGTVRISASDLELSIQTSCLAKVKTEGAATVPTKKLLNLVRLLPDGEIRFKRLENHWVQLTSDRKTYKLVGIASQNFPALSKMPESGRKISVAAFCGMIDKVAFAISSEESRYTLNGALTTFNHQFSMVATDGHRLALAHSADADCAAKESTAIIHKKALSFVASAAKELAEGATLVYASDSSFLFFQSDDWLIVSKKLEGRFPNYEAVLPKESTVVASVDCEELKAALWRVGQMSDARSRAVKFTIGETGIELSASSPESGEAKESVSADTKGNMEIGFNSNYVLDFLNHCGAERVSIGLKDNQSAGDFTPLGADGYRYVVMPMRI